MSAEISAIRAIQVLDSRGNPTVSVRVTLDDGSLGEAMVPSGASTGEFEAVELRDAESDFYFGKSVLKAVANVNDIIAPALKGRIAREQSEIDKFLVALDGTANKHKLGANAILGVSLAVASASAKSRKVDLFEVIFESIFESTGASDATLLPVPLVNVINGGAHANNGLDIQEFMIVAHGATTFSESVRFSAEVFHALGKLLSDDGYDTSVGDEGGYAPAFESLELVFEFLLRAIESAGYKPGEDISIALDVAASELVSIGNGNVTYKFSRPGYENCSADELISLYEEWLGQYPLVSIEDGLSENDWSGWHKLTSRLGSKVQLVGDDLFVTNTERIQRGLEEKVANSVLIKLNQIGTLSETLAAIELGSSAGYTNVISHRSGETSDTTISDLAVATNAGQIKTGSMCRGERISKYNRLLWIEEKLGSKARFRSPF